MVRTPLLLLAIAAFFTYMVASETALGVLASAAVAVAGTGLLGLFALVDRVPRGGGAEGLSDPLPPGAGGGPDGGGSGSA